MTQDTKKPRRARADSKEAAVADMLNADRVIKPPPGGYLATAERVLFDEIISELPKGEWTDHMVRLAADLARMMADARAEADAMRREGTVVTGASGGPIRNPRCAQLAALRAGIVASRRSLSLHSRAKAGMDNRVLSRRRAIQQQNEANHFDDEEGLIPRPSMN